MGSAARLHRGFHYAGNLMTEGRYSRAIVYGTGIYASRPHASAFNALMSATLSRVGFCHVFERAQIPVVEPLRQAIDNLNQRSGIGEAHVELQPLQISRPFFQRCRQISDRIHVLFKPLGSDAPALAELFCGPSRIFLVESSPGSLHITEIGG